MAAAAGTDHEAAGYGFDLELKLAEMKINGFAVLPQIVPKSQIAAMHRAFLPLLDAVVARDPGPKSKFTVEVGDPHVGMGRCQDAGGGGAAGAVDASGHRYTVTIPWVKPFADPLLYENPAVLAFLDAYWESDAYHITNYHSNNPRPGTLTQRWHRDTRVGCDIPFQSLTTCPCVGKHGPVTAPWCRLFENLLCRRSEISTGRHFGGQWLHR